MADLILEKVARLREQLAEAEAVLVNREIDPEQLEQLQQAQQI